MIGKKLKKIETSNEKCIEFIKRNFQRKKEDRYLHKECSGLEARVWKPRIHGGCVKFYLKHEVIAILCTSNELIFFPEMADDITGSRERAARRIVKLLEKELNVA